MARTCFEYERSVVSDGLNRLRIFSVARGRMTLIAKYWGPLRCMDYNICEAYGMSENLVRPVPTYDSSLASPVFLPSVNPLLRCKVRTSEQTEEVVER